MKGLLRTECFILAREKAKTIPKSLDMVIFLTASPLKSINKEK